MSELKERLSRVVGVWEGTYSSVTPDGDLIERYRSRQETSLDGDVWRERITYFRDEQEPQTYDFTGRFSGGMLLFEDDDISGDTYFAGEDILVLPYTWKSRPHEQVVETVILATASHKARVWQVFDRGELVRVMIIKEHLVIGD
ncbi:MAG: DUF3598 family protein [bacterium]|nr:DUF3598 family protein [bacterium]MDE0288154.1 DUF3598 family protein [bacterium]MDE0437105.1 DUF3598 family protein [bacterium]